MTYTLKKQEGQETQRKSKRLFQIKETKEKRNHNVIMHDPELEHGLWKNSYNCVTIEKNLNMCGL